MVSATATCFTCDACILERERPTGLSGCVTAAATSKPSPSSARSGAVANSGVPQKSTRTSELLVRVLVPPALFRRLERGAADEARILVLLQLPLRERGGAFEDAQVVEEQPAVEVVDLVLETAREQLRRLDLVLLPLEIHRADDDVLRSLDVRVDVGNREAALLRLVLRGASVDDRGIDHDERLSVDLDHGESLGPPDLRGREADPTRVVHRLEHVRDEAADFVRHLRDRRGGLAENGIAGDADVENAHGAAITLSRARSGRRRSARSS